MVPALNNRSLIIADISCSVLESHTLCKVCAPALFSRYSIQNKCVSILSICRILIHIALEHIGQYSHHYTTWTDDKNCGYDSGLLELKVHWGESFNQWWPLRKRSPPQRNWCCQTTRAPPASRWRGVQAVGTGEICVRWPSLGGATYSGIVQRGSGRTSTIGVSTIC